MYSDPTGAITITEINVAHRVETALRNLPTTVLRQLQQEVVNGVRQHISDALVDMLTSIIIGSVPGVSVIPGFGTTLSSAGEIFEATVENSVCDWLGQSGSEYGSWLRLAVPMRQSTGEPAGNGFSCTSRPSPAMGASARFRPGLSQVSYPDFLVSEHLPSELRRNSTRRSFLPGDIKLTVRSVGRGSLARRQLLTMALHARDFGLRTVLVIGMRGTSRSYELRLKELVAQRGAWLSIFSLFGGRR